MPDQEWLRNLAAARLVGGRLQAEDPNAVRSLVERRIGSTLEELQAQAEEYAATLSEVTGDRLNVRVLPHAEAAATGGFLLLLGRCQISLVRDGWVLAATLATVQAFERKPQLLHRFRPVADALGGLHWQMDNTLIMPGELIIKRLFEDLARAVKAAAAHAEGG